MQLDLDALTLFMLEEVDCSEDFEEDEFAVTFQCECLFVERHTTHFVIEVVSTSAVIELPRP